MAKPLTLERKNELAKLVKESAFGSRIEVKGTVEMDFVQTLLDSREPTKASKSDGSSADYYKLPRSCKQLQDLIAFRNMNAQIGEIFRATFRYGIVPHSPKERDLKKIIYYAQAELARLKKYEEVDYINNLDVGDL